MSTLLIEIGSEELPAKLVEPAIKHLLSNFTQVLSNEGIEFSDPEAFATPRRLALLFKDIKTQAPSRDQEEKGPPKSACFDKDGKPTKALEGFAAKVGIRIEDVEFKEIGNGTYATSLRNIKGRTLSDIVAIEFPKIVLSFPHPHSMRWDETGVSWVRPIRWIVALQDDKIIPMAIGKVNSDRFTRSPRPERIRKIEIQNPAGYPKILEKLGIIGNIQERKDSISSNASELAAKLGLSSDKDENLIDEITTIVERPVVVQGEFDKQYLETPRLIVETVLTSDLRFIPFFSKNDFNITNKFALVVNGPPEIAETVKDGELKVLNGRLSDAKFFYAEDRKHKLEYFVPKLSGIAFVKGLGTLKDKKDRMNKIAEDLTPILKERRDDFDENILLRACELAKADLATSMVQEHDTLQGKIGGLYAKEDCENYQVVNAISEHYYPQGEYDNLPNTLYGQIVATIDKTDSLINIISAGNTPKGSSDPLGVRRLAFGLIKLLIMNDVSINLSEILNICSKYIVRTSPYAMINTMNFLSERLEGYFTKSFRYDVVRSCMTSGTDDLKLLLAKIEIINKAYNELSFAGVVATCKRLNNILKDYKLIGSYDKNLFMDEDEKQFEYECTKVFNKIIDISDQFKKSLNEAYSSNVFKKIDIGTNIVNKTIRLYVLENEFKKQLLELQYLTEHAEKYFDNVMVNVEDEAIRSNRKNFLSWLLGQYLSVADFTQIAI